MNQVSPDLYNTPALLFNNRVKKKSGFLQDDKPARNRNCLSLSCHIIQDQEELKRDRLHRKKDSLGKIQTSFLTAI